MNNDLQPDPVMEEALLDTYIERQAELVVSGQIPAASPTVLARGSRWLALAGGIELGFFVACLTMLTIVIVLNLVFHIQ